VRGNRPSEYVRVKNVSAVRRHGCGGSDKISFADGNYRRASTARILVVARLLYTYTFVRIYWRALVSSRSFILLRLDGNYVQLKKRAPVLRAAVFVTGVSTERLHRAHFEKTTVTLIVGIGRSVVGPRRVSRKRVSFLVREFEKLVRPKDHSRFRRQRSRRYFDRYFDTSPHTHTHTHTRIRK